MHTNTLSKNIVATSIAITAIAMSITFAHADQGATSSTDSSVAQFTTQKANFFNIIDECKKVPAVSVGAPTDQATGALFTSLKESKKQIQQTFTEAKQSYEQAKQDYQTKVTQGATAGGVPTTTVIAAGARFKADRDAIFADGCEQISATSSVKNPVAYGAPYNVLSSKREQLIKTRCTLSSNDVALDVGNGSTLQYIYDTGYVWKNNQWTPFKLDAGTSTHTSGWIVGSATTDLVVPNATDTNYVVSYICTWQPATSSSGTGAWKCGCKDAACTVSSWQLQIVKAPVHPIAKACMLELDGTETGEAEHGEVMHVTSM